jgi:hypothetical protein
MVEMVALAAPAVLQGLLLLTQEAVAGGLMYMAPTQAAQGVAAVVVEALCLAVIQEPLQQEQLTQVAVVEGHLALRTTEVLAVLVLS